MDGIAVDVSARSSEFSDVSRFGGVEDGSRRCRWWSCGECQLRIPLGVLQSLSGNILIGDDFGILGTCGDDYGDNPKTYQSED